MNLPLDSERDEDPLEDDAPAAVLAVPGLGDAKRERRWLSAIAEAARLAATNERKASFLLRLLARSGRRLGEASIVFTEYRDTLARLEQRLTAAGHPISSFTARSRQPIGDVCSWPSTNAAGSCSPPMPPRKA